MEHTGRLIFFDEDEMRLANMPMYAPVEKSLDLLMSVNDERLNLQQELGQPVLWAVDYPDIQLDTARTVISDRLMKVRGLQEQLSDVVLPLWIGELSVAAYRPARPGTTGYRGAVRRRRGTR